MRQLGAWRTLSALVVVAAVAGCETVAPTPSASGGPSASPPSSPTTAPTPSPTASPLAVARWDSAGTLALARPSTRAVALRDGRVLVVGSDNVCTPGGAWDESMAAELFDPASGRWSATGSLNAPRDAFVAVALADGRVLVTGGLTSANVPERQYGAYSSTKLYDPSTGTWTSSGLLGVARMAPAAALLADGTVLVAGGLYVDSSRDRVVASAEIFDPEAGTWSRTSDLATARQAAHAVTLVDGRVLVVGGSGGTDESALASAELFDPATGRWTPGGSLATAREAFSLVALRDGGALVVGGTSGGRDGRAIASAERFDPRTLSWSSAGASVGAASNRAAVTLGDGRVLVAGGIADRTPGSDGPGDQPAVAAAELYDPATGTWVATAPLPAPREGAAVATLADGTVLLAGGDEGYVGEPRTPWCPEAFTTALRYVPENVASFPAPTPGPVAALAKSSVARAAASPAAAKTAAASINAFGIDLYRGMLADPSLGLAGKNAVVSPTSVALALAMARAGAAGETAAEMDAVLHASGWEALGPGLNALDQALASRAATWKDDEGVAHRLALRIANAAFAQRGWEIVRAYLDAIASTFGAGLRLVDFNADAEAARRTVNAWVSRQTERRIPELLGPGDVTADTRIVLVNAIYLKANWAREFPPEATKPAPFTRLDGSRISVPTMSLFGGQDVPLASGTGWKATELRYLGARGSTPLAMTLIVPDDLAAFEARLAPAQVAGIVAKLDAQRRNLGRVTYAGTGEMDCGTYPYSLNVRLPRFGIDTRASLVAALKALGMPLAFDPGAADFGGITASEPLYISAVIHQANIDLDEQGTEAAAATAVGVATGGCTGPNPARIATLRLDRPFLFALRDVETGAVLFMGRVVDPSAR